MRPISVQKVITTARLTITSLVATALIATIAVLYCGHKLQWPLAATLPLSFLLLFTMLITGIIWSGNMLAAWAYLNVDDVVELKKAAGIAGFHPLRLERIKAARSKAIIAERLTNYVFNDDAGVGPETILYNKPPYKQEVVIVSFIIMVLSTIPLVMYPDEATLLLLSLPPAAVLFYVYFRHSDGHAQLILSETGIDTRKTIIPWTAITEWRIQRNKQMWLHISYNGGKQTMRIDHLNASPIATNHLLHVYEQRSKAKGAK